MLIKRLILIVSIILLTATCYIYMNRNYDSLSRYPYGTEKQRALIKQYLDEREIKYIIDYSIDPDLFMDYMIYPNFIAYHIEDYNKAAKYFSYLNKYEIVDVVEKMYAKNIDVDSVLQKYTYFHYDEILKDLNKWK